MNILFIGYLAPDELVSKCSGHSPAGDNMIKNIVKELGRIGDVQLDVISALPMASFPKDRAYISSHSSLFFNANVYNVGYFNIPLIKQIYQKISFVRKALKLSKRKHYDIIICFNMYQQIGSAALNLQRKLSIPLVGFLADFPVEDKTVYRGGLRLVWNIIKRNTFSKIQELGHAILLNENASQFLSGKSDHICINGGVPENDVSEYKIIENRTIVYAGALTNYSGVKNLIKAVSLIDEFDCNLEIYGNGELKDYVIECQTDDKRIRYMGTRSRREIQEILKNSWILVNPRAVDDPISAVTFPSKVFEYLMTGRPVISTVFPGMPDNIEKLLFSCAEGSPQEIKSEIVRIWKMTPAELEAFINTSLKYIEENLSWNNQCSKIHAYLENIIDSGESK